MKFFTLRFIAIAISLSIVAVSCEEQQGTNYSAGLTTNTTTNISDEDIRFLFAAHNMALYNKFLASEAEIRSTATESFSMATVLVESNERLDEAISGIARQYNLSLPTDITEEQKATWKEMIKQKGWKFDKQFSSTIEDNLKITYQLFTNAVSSCKEQAVKSIAEKGINELKQHGQLILAQQEKIKERTGDTENDLLDVSKRTMAFEKPKKK